MLTNIENRLEELFQQIELLPADKVEAAEKVKIVQCLQQFSFIPFASAPLVLEQLLCFLVIYI